MLRKLTYFFIAISFFACSADADKSKTGETSETAETSEAVSEIPINEYSESKDGIHYGATIDDSNAIPFGQLTSALGDNDSMKLKVYAVATDVCQKKGCWMNVGADKTEEDGMMVKFKDYDFFMPFDVTGKKVVMEGFAYKQVTPVKDLQHYAEDAGKTPEEIALITEPKTEVVFVADGVIIPEGQ